MTRLQGYIETTYDKLVSVFGQPFSGDKTTAEWLVKVDDLDYEISIYDWKEAKTPKGLYQWHIGGTKKSDVDYIKNLLL